MPYKVGDKVVITDSKKVKGSSIRQIKEDIEYLVIGIDNIDDCPVIAVVNRINFLSDYEVPFIKFTKIATIEEVDSIKEIYPYIPPNKEIEELIIKLEFHNWGRAVDIAIDVALDQKDCESFMKLIKQK